MTIKDLKPTGVWSAFHSLTQIPRPSGHTEAVAAFLVDFANSNGAKGRIDEIGNVIMEVEATPGYENAKTVILQAHMDMVPQKTPDSKHNFETDPIETWIDGDWLKAKNTTLGADDGMGVAIAMAIVADKTIPHGPLEILVTKDEETGMYGAFGLKEDELKGNMLINIDSETEGELTIGCAGGTDINATLEYQEEDAPADSVIMKVILTGLLGGHSGLEINESRANANKLMARVLFATVNKGMALISSWTGGNMRNAIPRDGEVVVAVCKDKVETFCAEVEKIAQIFKEEYKDKEKNLSLTIETIPSASVKVIPEAIGINLVNAVMAARDGVMRYIPTIPEIVETSCNFSIITIGGGKAEFSLLARSASDTMKQCYCDELTACFSMAGMKVVLSGSYSGWNPNPSSSLLAEMKDVYNKMYGVEAKVLVVHAGLECGIFGPKYPKMEMVSVGPTLLSPHTPSERCFIPSVEKSFNYICEVLKALAEK
ncbi:MAG: aminoacyl-histidine dipeptidase [Prevotella sp.]|nr:aminoacyl-histidine dipeptidase [Candidatus Equicola stercoris]